MAKGGRRSHTGPKPKPTALHVVQGTFRGDRHGDQIQVPAKWPDPPAHLTDAERGLWDGLREHCEQWTAPSDWLAVNGVVSIASKVLQIQAAQRATETAANPISFKFTPSADGEPNMEPKENPLYGMELKAWRELRAFIGIMGLSPVDRARVQKGVQAEESANPLDKFVTRGRG